MPNIKALVLVVSDEKIFSCFLYISLSKTCDLPGHNLNKLGRGP